MSITHSRRSILRHVPSPAPSPVDLFPFPPSTAHSASNPNLRLDYSSNQDSPYPSASSFHGPYMGVILFVLLVTFFLMAAFSVYVRRFAFSMGGQPGSNSSNDRPGGLDRTLIEGLPIVVFHCTKGEAKEDESSVHAHEWRRRPDCVVCLNDFQEAESVRLLPKCEHCFHPECIDMWLFSHTTCPLCRRSLLPPPPCSSPNPPSIPESPS